MTQIEKFEPVATMSSREIAELCDKRHDNVMRDIRAMFEELGNTALSVEGSYLDSTGRSLPCFNLPKRTFIGAVNAVLVDEPNDAPWRVLRRLC